MNIINETLTAMFVEDGEVKPSTIIKKAAKKKHPLHEYFEWNDTVAGHQFRLQQARKMIRRATIIYEKQPQRLIHVPVINRDTGSEGVYKPIEVVAQVQSELESSLEEAQGQLNSLKTLVDTLQRYIKNPASKRHARAATKALEVADTELESIT